MKTLWFATSIKISGCVVLLLPFCFSMTFAQSNPFSRYYRNELIQKVTVPATEILGKTREGRVYLTQEDVIAMALQQNLNVNVERHNYLFDLWAIQRQRSVYDPTGTLDFSWNRQATPTASVLQGGLSVTDILTSHRYGYRQNFSTGSSLEVNFTGIRNNTSSFFASLAPAINTSMEFLFRQNLLEGFGRIGAEYEIEISRNTLDITSQEFQRVAQDIILDVLNRYWELQFSLQDIQVKQKSLEYATRVLEQNRSRFDVGTAARLEIVQSEAEASSRREELIRSQFNYRLTQDQLVQLITSYQDPGHFTGEIIPSTALYTPEPIPQSFENLQAMADEMHPQIQQMELDILNQQVKLNLSRDRLRPTLDLVAGYSQFGSGGRRLFLDFTKGFTNAEVVKIVDGGLRDSISQLFSSDFYGYVLGLNLQLPIFNTEARAQNAQAQISLDRAELRQESVKQTVSLSIRHALTQIEMNHARLEAAQATVLFSQERLEGEGIRFEVGIGTTRELIEAQRDLLEAESVLLRGQTDLIQSHHLLDNALGRTFERYKIRLDEALKKNIRY